jgi:protein-tyrosine phosphatase
MNVPDILVICSGNICRSPYAAGYLRQRLQGAGSGDVEVRSGGTLGIVGSPASPESVKLAAEEGFDISAHRSSAISLDAVDEAGIILVMEEGHRRALRERFPDCTGKVHLLSEYHSSVQDPARAPDIFDPIGLPLEEYRRCFSLVRDCLEGFLSAGASARA